MSGKIDIGSKPHIIAVSMEPDEHNQLVVQTKCPECGLVNCVIVDAFGWNKWLQDTFIQNAMPELTKSEKNTLVTGFCPPCWDHWVALEKMDD